MNAYPSGLVSAALLPRLAPPPPSTAQRKAAKAAPVAALQSRKPGARVQVVTDAPALHLVQELIAALFDAGMPRLVAHARRALSAGLLYLQPHVETWVTYAAGFTPDPRQALADHVRNWDALPKSRQQELTTLFAALAADRRNGLAELRQVMHYTVRELDGAEDAHLETLYHLGETMPTGLPEGFAVLHVDTLKHSARYACLTKGGQVVERAKYDPREHAFTYRTALGELGAVPLSQVTHVKPLSKNA